METEHESLKTIFQQEFSKMVAVISKMYGLQHIEIAEDVVSETFLLAAETWGVKGMPENPVAWLYTVAKRKTLYHFKRHKIFEQKIAPELVDHHNEMGELNFSEQNIKDSQLQMLFAICTPAIVSEAQIGLALRILCGFGIDEIAEAFLSKKDTIKKRLFRAKEKLRIANIEMEFPPENEIPHRLDNVLHVIYLLFNEGYYSKTQNQILQKDLCLEAMRLGIMLTEYEKTDQPKTNALIALMCFHASRFDARKGLDDSLILYDQQDESLWETGLINKGIHFLNRSAEGHEMSSYHLEAGIAYWHCIKADSDEKWKAILRLYDQLLRFNYSPSVALNRLFAFNKVFGPRPALVEAEKIRLENNHFYFTLLGQLYSGIDREAAEVNFRKATALAKTEADRQILRQKIERLKD
jgi:predicted RNA polymerase sigma factor